MEDANELFSEIVIQSDRLMNKLRVPWRNIHDIPMGARNDTEWEIINVIDFFEEFWGMLPANPLADRDAEETDTWAEDIETAWATCKENMLDTDVGQLLFNVCSEIVAINELVAKLYYI